MVKITINDNVAKLKYPELEKINHVHHAGNSSGIVDGAAAMLVGTKEFGEKNSLKPRARILASEKVGTDPTIMLTGPVPATKKVLASAGMSIGDIDLFEVNEAFAPQVLAVQKELDLDNEKLNVNGGALAVGHPLAASGARITAHLVHELRRRGDSHAIGSACIGGGQGIAITLEAVK